VRYRYINLGSKVSYSCKSYWSSW